MSEVLSVRKASERLPVRTQDARAWLRREGLISELAGREVVVWSDVLERLRQSTPARPRRQADQQPAPRPATPAGAGLWSDDR